MQFLFTPFFLINSLTSNIFSFVKNFFINLNVNNFQLKLTPNFLNILKNNFLFKNYIFYWYNGFTSLSKNDVSSVRFTKTYNSTNEVNSKNIFYSLISISFYRYLIIESSLYLKSLTQYLTILWKKSFSFGFYYIQGFVFLLFIDACLTDDEPLWEPIEWSLVQTWILFIFIFGWIAENLIVSRYGSYTGRDKRVWMGWYKSFWMLEIYYVINFGITACFVIVPFYFELNYTLPFIYSWWHWYSRVFFFKFISLFTIVLLIAYCLQIGLRWVNWKKSLILVILINIFLSYLLYTHFIMAFFGYFTDPIWYQKSRPVDYIQLSHEPARWGWGPAKKDHFTYHGVKTVFWFKNDGPFASAFLVFQLYVFLSLFFVYIYWIALFRRVYSTKEIPMTYTTYCVSSLKQFFYCFLGLYSFIFISYISNYWRLPMEYYWTLNSTSWFLNTWNIFKDYPNFLLNIFY